MSDEQRDEVADTSSAATVSSAATASSSVSTEQTPIFKPIVKRAKSIQILVIIQLSFAAAILVLFIGSIAAEALQRHDLSELSISCIDALGVLQTILYLVTASLFIRMLLHAFRNLTALGATGTFNKEWHVVWSWFIPIANLFIPFSVVREIWKASDPAVLDSVAWKQSRGSKLIGAWWILHLIAIVFYGACIVLTTLLMENPRNEALMFAILPSFVLAEAVFIAAGVLFILVTRKLASRQERKLELAKAAV